MELHTIKGTIEVLGDSLTQVQTGGALRFAPHVGPKKYEYIQFRDTEGATVIVNKVHVKAEVDRVLSPGASGVFLISKGVFSKDMFGAKVGDEEATFKDTGLVKPYIGLSILAIIAFALSFVLVGIPFFVACLWGMIRYPAWRSAKLLALQKAGFTRLTAETYHKVI